MNCAMPCARAPLRVTGPTALGWKRLSCHITRAKNSSGRSLARAADSIIRHIASRALESFAGSDGCGRIGSMRSAPGFASSLTGNSSAQAATASSIAMAVIVPVIHRVMQGPAQVPRLEQSFPTG